MNKDDLIHNLGTIAKSGTKAFMETLSHQDNTSMIGQFGVGFYSAFLVADKVQFITKAVDDQQYIWESGAGGFFTTIPDNINPSLGRGSEVRLFLKENQQGYLDEGTIKKVVKVHSEFISYLIELLVEKEVGAEDNRFREVVTETEELNLTKLLWTHHPNEILFEEYTHFYQVLTNDFQDPRAVKHFSVDGQLEFGALLFLPKHPRDHMFEPQPNGIKFYVRHVFITDNCEALIPDWLNFVIGIIDSEDLPLNISRESLQHSKILKVIRKNFVKRCIEMIQEMVTDADYELFYKAFAVKLKVNVLKDEHNRTKIARLLRFYSTQSMDETTSFDDYIHRILEDQLCIYYIVSESRLDAFNSPFLENFKKKGIEVLLMTDPMDEYAFARMKIYNNIPLVNITTEGVELDHVDFEAGVRLLQEEHYHHLCMVMKDVLGDRVEKVVLSHLLSDSACVLSTSHEGWTANMEHNMKAQTLHSSAIDTYMISRRILELNPDHPIIKILEKRVHSPITHTTKDLIFLIFETALLTSGFTLDDPSHFSNRINKLIALGLDAKEEEIHMWHTR